MNNSYNNFNLAISTKIYFGEKSFSNILSILIKDNIKSILIISSVRTVKTPEMLNIIEKIKIEKIKIYFNSDVKEDPTISQADACYEIYKDKNIECVLGIGGGSAQDLSKSVASSLDLKVKTSELFINQSLLKKRKIKLILVPTTSGSGSELSFGSILTDDRNNIKKGLRGEYISADYAIIDPELTYSLSIKNTMICGFDVLTHAIETYISTKSNSLSTLYSEVAIKNVFTYLPKLKHQPNDIVARNAMSFSSMLMGINLSFSSTCLPHRLQYPVGAVTKTPHAVGLAALYPAWLKHLSPFAKEKLGKCGGWIMQKDINTINSLEKYFSENVINLIEDIGMKKNLKELGVKEKNLKNISDLVDGSLDTDPSYRDSNDILKIYNESFNN